MARSAEGNAITSTTGRVLGDVDGYNIQLLDSPTDIEADWKTLEQECTGCIYQNYDWVRIACKTLEKDHSIFIITGRNENGLQFILPMVLDGRFLKTLRWIGNTHANICSGLYSESFLSSPNQDIIKKVFKLIAKSVGLLAKLNLANQPELLKRHKNPLLSVSHQLSVNKMYDTDLSNGMDAVLDAGNGKRKRKLWRKQNRVAEDMGGMELVVPETQDDQINAIDEFLKLKSARLSEMGVKDVFADDDTRDFMYQLATFPQQEHNRLFKIYQLKIAGETRAIYALGIYGSYAQAYVNAVSYDEFSQHSPGEMILYAMIEDLVANDVQKFDLGVGYERYKKSWCPNETDLYDNIIPLTPLSIPYVYTVRALVRLKRYLRNNQAIWLKLKQLRKLTAKAGLKK